MGGNDNTYEGVTAVKLNQDDGSTQIFSKGEAVEKEIALDFSTGDMAVAEENKLFSTVTIPKPENLVPENVAKGVDIAGIIGAMAAGGELKINCGKISTAGAVTIEHGLGVVPDIIIVNGGAIKGCLTYAIGFSSALQAKIDGLFGSLGNCSGFYAYITSGNVKEFSFDGSTSGMEYSTTEPTIRNVTAESFVVGSATYPALLMSNGIIAASGKWVAISF